MWYNVCMLYTKLRYIVFAVLLLVSFLGGFNGVTAQTTPQDQLFNCFDSYHFGSVNADVYGATKSLVGGTKAHFNLTVVNKNTYPIVDGSVYVKIFKVVVGGTKDVNGPDVVDQFIAVDNISLAATGTKNYTFDWNVPSHLATGDYRIATFVVSAKKFNLLGLTFTNDVIGNTYDFKISSEYPKTVTFDRTTVTVNKQSYHFAAAPVRLSSTESATVLSKLSNPFNTLSAVPVTWKLYRWDGLKEDALVSSTTEVVILQPNETKTVTFITGDTSSSVYYLVEEAENVRVESETGVFDLSESTTNEMQYEHQNKIHISNYLPGINHLRFIQVIPKHKIKTTIKN